MHQDSLVGTRSLQILDLHNNHLSFVDMEQAHQDMGKKSPFEHVEQLRVLNLRNNSVFNILADWQTSNLRLEELDLSYNNITYLNHVDLDYLSEYITVNLSHNAIGEINYSEIDLAILEQIKPVKDKQNIILNNNPLRCNCQSYYFIKLLQSEVYSRKLKITADDLQCAFPPNLAGQSAKELHLKDLVCPLDSPNTKDKRCPANCSCLVRQHDSVLMLNCSNAGLTEIPVLPHTNGIQSIELYIENNNISSLSRDNMSLSQSNISEIHARNNSIRKIYPENLPRTLQMLDVSHNKLSFLNESVLHRINATKSLQTLYLAQNPWECACEAKGFLSFVRSNYMKIVDNGLMKCANGALLGKVGDQCSNHQKIYIAIGILIAMLGLFLGAIAALYYKYQQEIKVWLFAHNLCMWFVTEEELDKDKKYDAFVSFSHEDEDFVTEHLQPELEGGPHPFKLCLHFRDWVVGEFIPHQVSILFFPFVPVVYRIIPFFERQHKRKI